MDFGENVCANEKCIGLIVVSLFVSNFDASECRTHNKYNTSAIRHQWLKENICVISLRLYIFFALNSQQSQSYNIKCMSTYAFKLSFQLLLTKTKQPRNLSRLNRSECWAENSFKLTSMCCHGHIIKFVNSFAFYLRALMDPTVEETIRIENITIFVSIYVFGGHECEKWVFINSRYSIRRLNILTYFINGCVCGRHNNTIKTCYACISASSESPFLQYIWNRTCFICFFFSFWTESQFNNNFRSKI